MALRGKAFSYSGHALAMINVADDFPTRDFNLEMPDQKWVTAIGHIWAEQRWEYLATLMELYSRRNIGWLLGDDMTSDLMAKAM